MEKQEKTNSPPFFPFPPLLSLSHLRRQHHGHIVPTVKQGQRLEKELFGGDLVGVEDADDLAPGDAAFRVTVQLFEQVVDVAGLACE